ncbi:MAG: LamG domain-containing protein [Candidatus Eremiobacteraeota bacterium]|nr:LamG domain-containing protein [Candidatus Eremiobacteraeota bacterium]
MTVKRLYFSCFILFLLLYPLCPAPAGAAEKARILFLPFNGNANDTCGGKHHGKVNGATLTTGHDGKPDSAYYFDGKSSIDVGALGPLSSFTVIFWVYPEAYENHRNVFTLGGLSEKNERFRAELHNNWQGQKFTAFFGTGHGEKQYKTIGVNDTWHLPLNKWSLVAMVHDSSTKENSLYINNQLIGTVTGEVKLPSPWLSLGVGYQKTPERYFKGRIDDFSVFSGVLSASQIESVAGAAVAYDNPQGTSAGTSAGTSTGTTTGTTTGTSAGSGTGQPPQNATPLVDSDNDKVYDNYETVFRTDKNNPDTDGDGIIDGEDLSPTVNPQEPTDWKDLQEIGMMRLTFPIKAYGLDGWVEEYLQSRSTGFALTFIGKYTNTGVKKSTMSKDKVKKAVNRVFGASDFTCYDLKNISPDDINVLDTKKTAEHVPNKSEYSHTYPANPVWGKIKEYRFYYDYVTDYWMASFKNKKKMKFPGEDSPYRYLLYSVKLKKNCENSIAMQFKSSTLADAVSTGAVTPVFTYSLYGSSNYDTPPLYEGTAAVLNEKGTVYSVNLRLPRESCTASPAYLKITPLSVTKGTGQAVCAPLPLSWDLTGITRTVVHSSDGKGNSTVQSEDMGSFSGLTIDVVDKSKFKNQPPSEDVRTEASWIGMLVKDPSLPGETTVTDEMITISSRGFESSGNTQAGVTLIIESSVLKTNKVSEITELPANHWARDPYYTPVMTWVNAWQGAASVVTNGLYAWKSYKEGDTIKTVYYGTRAGTAGVQTTAELVELIERTDGFSGSTGKLKCLASKKACMYIAIAAGVVEVGSNIVLYKTTSDPLSKDLYAENIMSSIADTELSVAAVYSPHALAFQATWTIEVEIYAAIFGENFAYKCAKTPGTALVFLAKYFCYGSVPTQMAEAEYKAVRTKLVDMLKNMYVLEQSKKLPYSCIFVDPDL